MAKALTPTSPWGRGDVVFTPYGRQDQFRIRSKLDEEGREIIREYANPIPPLDFFKIVGLS